MKYFCSLIRKIDKADIGSHAFCHLLKNIELAYRGDSNRTISFDPGKQTKADIKIIDSLDTILSLKEDLSAPNFNSKAEIMSYVDNTGLFHKRAVLALRIKINQHIRNTYPFMKDMSYGYMPRQSSDKEIVLSFNPENSSIRFPENKYQKSLVSIVIEIKDDINTLEDAMNLLKQFKYNTSLFKIDGVSGVRLDKALEIFAGECKIKLDSFNKDADDQRVEKMLAQYSVDKRKIIDMQSDAAAAKFIKGLRSIINEIETYRKK